MITINNIKISPLVFSDRTSQVWKLPDDLLNDLYKEGTCTIKWDFEQEAEFLWLAQLRMLLDTYCPIINLEMDYLPYARQDKRIDNTTTFALHTFAKLLNSLNFNEVSVLDAHSPRAHMIHNLVDKSPRKHIASTKKLCNADLLLFPDAGAQTRYGAYPELGGSVYANKTRDQSTGFISGISIVGKVAGKKLLLVDDIADGSMTFILLAKEALKQGAKEVHLFVTHGIFSKGTKVVFDAGISRIFTHKGEEPRVSIPVYDGGH